VFANQTQNFFLFNFPTKLLKSKINVLFSNLSRIVGIKLMKDSLQTLLIQKFFGINGSG
jgi:hypothetical protein